MLRFDTSYWVLKEAGNFGEDHHYYEADFNGVVERKSAYIKKDTILSEKLKDSLPVSGLLFILFFVIIVIFLIYNCFFKFC